MRASGLSLLRACESGNKGSGTSVANPFEERGIFFIELEPVFARDRIKGNPRGNINRGEGEREWKWSCKSRDRSKVYFFRIRNIFSNQFEHKFFFTRGDLVIFFLIIAIVVKFCVALSTVVRIESQISFKGTRANVASPAK